LFFSISSWTSFSSSFVSNKCEILFLVTKCRSCLYSFENNLNWCLVKNDLLAWLNFITISFIVFYVIPSSVTSCGQRFSSCRLRTVWISFSVISSCAICFFIWSNFLVEKSLFWVKTISTNARSILPISISWSIVFSISGVWNFINVWISIFLIAGFRLEIENWLESY
jgi:hypothetical protein